MKHVLYVVTSEKAVRGIERENKLTFIISNDSTKDDVKKEVEAEYGEQVKKITTMTAADGRKKAVVAFKKENVAADLAAKLKVI